MNKLLYLSLVTASLLYSDEVDLGSIDVEETIEQEVIKDIHGEDIRSADVAKALFEKSASISLKRRSGIANDIVVRGQLKDNISVTIDGAKVHGACPNRMDPPISHILSNNIDYIEISKGPFDVEEFGSLSAGVKVYTIKPTEEIHGDISLNVGSWSYQKGSFTLSGGSSDLKFLISGSTEVGGQYEDGDGNDFVGQIDKNIKEGKIPASAQYLPQYRDMDAFSKDTMMAKVYWDITDNQELQLSYTANRSDDVLYPSSKMDAIYDDSDIFTLNYSIKELGEYSKNLDISLYNSTVEHPMSTKYREVSAMKGFEMTHKLTTDTTGAKIKNSFDIDNHNIIVGVDYSLRNWDGRYYKNGNPFPEAKFHSIYDADTTNYAFFVEDSIKLDRFVVDVALRYDDTEVTSQNIKQQSNDYSQLNGYITASYHSDEDTKYFVGVGKSSRVPDAKELYWIGSMGNSIGTPTLDETINYEIDLGVEKQWESSLLKGKVFYSMLDDYIAYNASSTKMMMDTRLPWNAYENVDASIYGIEVSGSYIATDSIVFDYALAYQRGEKDTPLRGQVGTDMADIAPLKFNGAINYEYDESLDFKLELVASDSWSEYDEENGEQEIDSYAVINLKANKSFAKGFELTVGVDNLFDETYAVSNTYKDLILLSVPNNQVMLLNEAGRYFYANLKYKF